MTKGELDTLIKLLEKFKNDYLLLPSDMIQDGAFEARDGIDGVYDYAVAKRDAGDKGHDSR